MLPDRSILIGQKLVKKNAKIEKFKCDILGSYCPFFFEYRAKNTFFFYFTSLTLSWLILDPLVVVAVVVLVVPPLLALEE